MSHTSPSPERDSPENRFDELRRRMVDTQIAGHGIRDERVLDAMRRVPREKFVQLEKRDAAYEDGPLSIGFGQTISQPFTVAFMCQALQLTGTEKVLEIGTGSGYGAAVLSLLAKSVHSIERIPELADQARFRLEELGMDNVAVITGDGTLGLASEAPFDAIVVTAGAESLPDAYVEQVRLNGRIVIPIGGYRHDQQMYRYTRQERELQVERLGGFVFVPLIGKYGWDQNSGG
jgi:protein-L-isoaspartate(D-aspartate) O-methyltransferase